MLTYTFSVFSTKELIIYIYYRKEFNKSNNNYIHTITLHTIYF